MTLRRDPLLLPLAAFLGGILAARAWSFCWQDLAGVAAAAVLLWFLTHRAAILAFVAIAGAAVYEAHRPGRAPELTSEDNETLIVAGCVVDPPTPGAELLRFVIEIEPGARVRASLMPKAGEPRPDLRYGSVVELEARVRKPRNFGNPGSFDFNGYLARRAIYWTASARGVEKLRVVPGECGDRWRALWFGLRGEALRRIEALYGSNRYTGAMLAGMLIGDANAIERAWTEDFRRTGTYHTLVISGLHITVLAGSVLAVLRLCFIPLVWRLVAAGATAWAYALVTGLEAPVTRSAAGFTLFLIARFLFRRGRVLNLLAAVAFVYLAVDPQQLFEASFQLSFLAVAAIGALGIPLLDATSGLLAHALRGLADTERDAALPARVAALRVELRMLADAIGAPLWLLHGVRPLLFAYESFVISLCVQLALVLPLAAYFHRLSATSLVANVLVVPLLSFAVPVGFLAIVAEARWLADVAGWLLSTSQWIVSWHARWEPDWRIPDVPPALAFTFAAALASLAFSRWRRAAGATAAASLVMICVYPFVPAVAEGALEVTAIDVGQGDSLLTVFPDGTTLVVDGGGIPQFDSRSRVKLDIGEDVVSPYLWTRRFRRVDIVAMTHGHDDHSRGLAALIENFQPSELWTGVQPGSGVWLEVEAAARKHNVRVVRRNAGERMHFGGAEVEVLAPASAAVGSAAARNNDSLVLRVQHGRNRFLLTGDIEGAVEGAVDFGAAAVIKVAHHGSKTSTSEAFLDTVRPAFALISSGRYNSYGHPHPAVLERLTARHIQVLRTDELGLITFRSDGRRLMLETPGRERGVLPPILLD